MTICSKIKGICKSDLVRVEEKKTRALLMLGVEIWNLYQDNVFQSILEQDAVKEVITDLSEYEEDIKRIKMKMTDQKKEKERRIAFRKATSDLKNSDVKVRNSTISVLEKLGGKEAISLLNRALNDPEPEVCRNAAEALHRLVDISIEKTVENIQEKNSIEIKMPEESLEEYTIGGNWYAIDGKKVLGKKKALEMLSQSKNNDGSDKKKS